MIHNVHVQVSVAGVAVADRLKAVLVRVLHDCANHRSIPDALQRFISFVERENLNCAELVVLLEPFVVLVG